MRFEIEADWVAAAWAALTLMLLMVAWRSQRRIFLYQGLLVTFGVPVPAGTKPADFFSFLQQQGYLRVWLDGEILRTDEPTEVKRLHAAVEVVQDRVTISDEGRSRLTEAIEHALRLGSGKLAIRHPESGFRHPYSAGWHCAHCDVDITPPSPGLFSFNHPLGACPTCRGFGRTIAIDLLRALPDRTVVSRTVA